MRERLGKGGGYGSGYRWAVSSVLTAAAGWAILGLTTPRPLQAMSEEQLTALLAKIKEDTALQEKLKGSADLDAAVALAKEAGFNVSKADWLEYQAKQTVELSDEELSDLELAGVSGGGFQWWLGRGLNPMSWKVSWEWRTMNPCGVGVDTMSGVADGLKGP